jgi:hypothetical protein
MPGTTPLAWSGGESATARFAALAATLGLLLAPAGAGAAEVTAITSAFDDDAPFELKIQIGWLHSAQRTKITREHLQAPAPGESPTIVDVTELQYRRTLNQLRPTVRAGLYKDLEFTFTWPYVFRETQGWGPADLPGLPQNSTLHNTQGICADGRQDAGSCAGPLFPFTDDTGRNSSYRSGLDNGTVGVRWGILNEARHPWSANWVVGAGWSFPMVNQRSPVIVSNSPDDPATYADRVNRWHLETALSRQVGPVDPFIRFHYMLPYARRNAYHNCDNAQMLADMNRQDDGVQNTCSGREWTRNGNNRGALRPAHVGGIEFGAEVLPYLDPEEFIRVAIQLSAGAAYVSEGRDYTILSDALQRLTYHDEYAHLHATLGLRAQASRFAKFNALFTLAHDTPYFITRETIGRDLTGSGVVDLTYSQQDIEADERNPNFDFRWDQPGRRFRAEETTYFTIFLMGELNF